MKAFLLLLSLLIALSCAVRNRSESPVAPTENAQTLQNPNTNQQNALNLLSPPDTQASYFQVGPLTLPALYLTQYPGSEYPFQICQASNAGACQAGAAVQQGTLTWGARIFPNLAPGAYTASVKSCARVSWAVDAALQCGLEEMVSLSSYAVQAPNDELLSQVNTGLEISNSIRSLAVNLQTALLAYRNAVPADNSPFSNNVDTLLHNGPDINGALLNSSQIPNIYLAVSGTSPLPTGQNSSNDLNNTSSTQGGSSSQSRASKLANSAGSVLIAIGVETTIAGIIVTGIAFAGEHFAVKGGELISKTSAQSREWLNSNVSKTVDESFEAGENILASPLGFKVPFDKKLLERSLGTDIKNFTKETITNVVADDPGNGSEVLTFDHNGIEIYKDSASGEIKYYIENDKVYKATAKFQSTAQVGLSINKADWEKLSKANQFEFDEVPAGSGSYALKDTYKPFYKQIGDFYYRKNTPMSGSILPNLDADTLADLADAQTLNKGDDYGKGIPLFDPQGRLVEPPDHWKVAGENWFYNPTGRWFSKTHAPISIKIKKARTSRIASRFPDVKTFDAGDITQAEKVVNQKYYQWTDNIKGGVLNWFGTEKMWNIHMSIQSSSQSTKEQIGTLQDKAFAQLKTNVQDPLAKEKVAPLAFKAKALGGSIILGGLGAITLGVISQQLGLAANPAQQTLSQTLSALDTQLFSLQQQRLSLAGVIGSWLQTNKYPVPDPDWLSYL